MLGCGPTAELTGQLHADKPRILHFPVQTDHDVHRVGAPDTAGHHAQAPAVGSVAVRPDDQAAGKGVIFQNDLVNDPRTRFPEAHFVAGRRRAEEFIDFLVQVQGVRLIVVGALVGQQEMVAVDRGRDGGLVASGLHELQDGHLGGRVLHGDTIGPERQGCFPAFEFLPGRIGQMSEKHLFGQGQGPAKPFAHDRKPLPCLIVDIAHHF